MKSHFLLDEWPLVEYLKLTHASDLWKVAVPGVLVYAKFVLLYAVIGTDGIAYVATGCRTDIHSSGMRGSHPDA